MTKCSDPTHNSYGRIAVGTFTETFRTGPDTRETRTFNACQECLDNRDDRTQVFTKDWHYAQVDRLASQMRTALAHWFEADRTDDTEVRRLYGIMLTASRSLAAELSAIGAINYQEATR